MVTARINLSENKIPNSVDFYHYIYLRGPKKRGFVFFSKLALVQEPCDINWDDLIYDFTL